MRLEKSQQCLRLAARCAQVNVGDKDGPVTAPAMVVFVIVSAVTSGLGTVQHAPHQRSKGVGAGTHQAPRKCLR